jgi:periplasmic divalent cation tolerance protein
MNDPNTHSLNEAEALVLAYVPCPSLDTAQQLAKTLIQQKLVACANILPGMVSLYIWEGALQQDNECVLLLKTLVSQQSLVKDFIEQHHPYDTPCVLFLKVDDTSQLFRQWIHQSLLR